MRSQTDSTARDGAPAVRPGRRMRTVASVNTMAANAAVWSIASAFLPVFGRKRV